MKSKGVRGKREMETITTCREYEKGGEGTRRKGNSESTEAILRVRALWLLTVPQQQKPPGQEEQLKYQKRGILINDIKWAPKRNQPKIVWHDGRLLDYWAANTNQLL